MIRLINTFLILFWGCISLQWIDLLNVLVSNRPVLRVASERLVLASSLTSGGSLSEPPSHICRRQQLKSYRKIQRHLLVKETGRPTIGSWARSEIVSHQPMLRSLSTFFTTCELFVKWRTSTWTLSIWQMWRICSSSTALLTEVIPKAQRHLTHPTRPIPNSLHHASSELGVTKLKIFESRTLLWMTCVHFCGYSCFARPATPGWCRTRV